MVKNAVDAHRKALKKKELKRNKEDRKKAREISTVKKDTRTLEADVKRLASKRDQTANDKEQLAALRAELERINSAKATYVEAHPEHHKFVYPERPESKNASAGPSRDPPGLYTKEGKLKHPERSIYFDPVFNPFGAPPPGMPYRERPPTAEEMAAFRPVIIPPPTLAAPPKQTETENTSDNSEDEDEDEDSDDDDGEDDEDDDDIIAMPEGPPPEKNNDDSEDESDNSLSDIAMPEGPPPPKINDMPTNGPANFIRPTIQRPNGGQRQFPPHHHHQNQYQQFRHQPYPNRPPPGFRPPPRIQNGMRPPPHHLPSRPPPPAQFDPITGEASTNYQAHQHARRTDAQVSHPSGDVPPPSSAASTTSTPNATMTGLPTPYTAIAPAAAVISAAPQLRDFKKEATAFMPSNLRKKKATARHNPTAITAGLGAINAARGSEAGTSVPERASLLTALKDAGIGGQKATGAVQTKAERAKEDYARFESEMADFL